MNREIKFRGKSINTKKWVYGYFVRDETLKRGGWGIIPGKSDEWIDVIPETVGQYTEKKR
jgi:hypothetical protein